VFDQILNFLQMLLAKLPGISFGAIRKHAFAKSLLEMHSKLFGLCQNGDEILTILETHRTGGALDEVQFEIFCFANRSD
jgi:hypothetical protein